VVQVAVAQVLGATHPAEHQEQQTQAAVAERLTLVAWAAALVVLVLSFCDTQTVTQFQSGQD
jgi:uncharacterized membrane protein YadS